MAHFSVDKTKCEEWSIIKKWNGLVFEFCYFEREVKTGYKPKNCNDRVNWFDSVPVLFGVHEHRFELDCEVFLSLIEANCEILV